MRASIGFHNLPPYTSLLQWLLQCQELVAELGTMTRITFVYVPR